jgi:hypothetical protein
MNSFRTVPKRPGCLSKLLPTKFRTSRYGLVLVGGGEIELSLFYTGFRILVAPLGKFHAADLGALAITAANSLGFRELFAPGGRFSVHYQSHLRPAEGSSSRLLRELMNTGPNGFEPDGCSYLFTPPEPSGVKSAKFLVERSLRIAEGLFIDCKLEFDVLLQFDALIERSTEIIGYAIDSIGIQLQ